MQSKAKISGENENELIRNKLQRNNRLFIYAACDKQIKLDIPLNLF